MTQSIQELEQEIEESRARLDLTIDRLQDRLSISGIADEMMGSVRTTSLAPVFDRALAVVRRNPVPVILVAAGIGWLLRRMGGNGLSLDRKALEDESDIPVLNTGHARIYDPDAEPRHPSHDTLESRRDLNARA